MYLKKRYQLGYESLVAEVTDSMSWRRFRRITLSELPGRARVTYKGTSQPHSVVPCRARSLVFDSSMAARPLQRAPEHGAVCV
jgi:hypothetical protein